MGQAKQRGSYIERRNTAIQRAEQERILKRKQKKEQMLKTSSIATLIAITVFAASYFIGN